MPDTFHFISLVASASAIQVYPEWDGYEERRVPIRGQHRTETGALHVADQGAYLAYTVPLAVVNSSQANEFNGWWADQREVAFTFSFSSNPKVVICRIENDSIPMAGYERTRRDLYHGTLFLRETRGQSDVVSGTPLIADDAVYGISDSTFFAV